MGKDSFAFSKRKFNTKENLGMVYFKTRKVLTSALSILTKEDSQKVEKMGMGYCCLFKSKREGGINIVCKNWRGSLKTTNIRGRTNETILHKSLSMSFAKLMKLLI